MTSQSFIDSFSSGLALTFVCLPMFASSALLLHCITTTLLRLAPQMPCIALVIIGEALLGLAIWQHTSYFVCVCVRACVISIACTLLMCLFLYFSLHCLFHSLDIVCPIFDVFCNGSPNYFIIHNLFSVMRHWCYRIIMGVSLLAVICTCLFLSPSFSTPIKSVRLY